MSSELSQVRLLARHFFRRFLDNDLTSPDGEMQANLAAVVALLAVPGLLAAAPLLLTYGDPYVTTAERLVMALDHKFLLISCSMIVMAMATVVEWDALALDARDLEVLGPLPIERRVLMSAKLIALGRFVAIFGLAVTAIPAVLFPLIWLATVPVQTIRGLWLIAALGIVSLTAAAFAFLAVLALRSLLASTLPQPWFRRASLVVQPLLILALSVALLLLPGVISGQAGRIARGGPAVSWSPPAWFLGVHEMMTAPVVLGDPAVEAEGAAAVAHLGGGPLPIHLQGRRQPILAWQARREHGARGVYRGLDRPLADLGSRALVAVPVSALLAVGLYLVSHLGAGAQVRPEQGRRAKGRARRLVAGLAPRIGARDPVSRATFVFTLQTLARSTRHRLYVAGALAAGCALLVAVNAPDLAREGLAALRLPTPQLLAIQFVLAVCLLIALRAVFTVPAALRANWIFRLTENAAHRPATAGARRAAAAVVLLLLAVLFPAHLLMWGARVALLHFTAGLLASLAVAAALFSGFRKIPFTCSSVPGKSSVRLAWPIYVLLFLAGTFGLAAVERIALETPTGSALLLGILFVILILLGIRGRWTAGADRSLVFFEEPDRTQALGLTE